MRIDPNASHCVADARVDGGTGGIDSLGNPEQRHQLLVHNSLTTSGLP